MGYEVCFDYPLKNLFLNHLLLIMYYEIKFSFRIRKGLGEQPLRICLYDAYNA